MPKFLSPVNLTQNELQNAVLQNLATAPSSPKEGQIYQDTTTHKTYVYNGISWQDMTGSSISPVLSGDITTTGLSNVTTLKNTGTSGTYTKVTTDAQGRVTSGSTLDVTDIPSITVAKVNNFQAAVNATPVSSLSPASTDMNLNNYKIANLATPISGTDAVNKNYVDSARAGLSIKDPVRVASAANIVISTGTLLSVDGVTVVAGDRVLLKNQTTTSENGIYIASTGAWTRSVDADTSSEVVAGMAVWVNEGTTNGDSRWVLTTNDDITIGTTSLVFTKDFQAADIVAGSGLTKTGNTLNAIGTTNRITANADSIDIASTYVGQTTITTLGTVTTGTWNATAILLAKGGTGATTAVAARTNLGAVGKYVVAIGDGTTTSFTVTHSLGTQDVMVSVVESASPYEIVYPNVYATSVNTVTVAFAMAPTSGRYRVVVTA